MSVLIVALIVVGAAAGSGGTDKKEGAVLDRDWHCLGPFASGKTEYEGDPLAAPEHGGVHRAYHSAVLSSSSRKDRGNLAPVYSEYVAGGVLNWMLEAPPPLRDGPVAIMGTLSGEQHELGALLAAAAAALEGWRVTFLGRDLPAHDLALAARTLDARMVAVSTVHATDLDEFEEQLTELLDGLAGDVDVFVGGVRARELRLAQTDDRLHVAHSLAEFREAIRGTGVPA